MKLMKKQWFSKAAKSVLASAILAAPLSMADDIDIYFSDSDTYSALGIKPNILFILDTSGSMDNTDAGGPVTLPADDITNTEFPIDTGYRRISHMKDAVYRYLDRTDLMDDVNVGIMRFNRQAAGVVYPISEGDTYNAQLNAVMAEMRIGATRTPVVNVLYEAALYYTGGDVYYGISRGTQGDPTPANLSSSANEFRISHEDAVIPGTASINNPSGCPANNLNDSDCDERRWQNGSTMLSPGQTVVKYKTPVIDQCQPNHMILLTDGNANRNNAAELVADFVGLDSSADCVSTGDSDELCGEELLYYLKNNDLFTDTDIDPLTEKEFEQTITTHVIGFNYDSPWLEDLAKAGGGLYTTASDSDSLIDKLTAITDQVMDTSSTFAAPVATINQFNRLVQRNEVYFAVFKPDTKKRWEGNIKKYSLGSTATRTNVILDVNTKEAVDPSSGFFKETSQDFFDDGTRPTEFLVEQGGVASQIPDERNVYTWLGASNILSGEDDASGYTNRVHEDNTNITNAMLGLGNTADDDAKRAELLLWAKGLDPDNAGVTRKSIGDPLHSKPVVVTYGGSEESPILTMFFGTNEGYFHAVDANSGEELWSFIPEELLANLDDVSSGAEGDHIYGVDGAPTVWVNDVDDDGKIESEDNDFVYVYFGLRRGGSHYYAMDVTDRENPKMLWSINDATTGFEDLGETWSKPIKTVVGQDDGSSNTGCNGNNPNCEEADAGDLYDILGVSAKHVLFFAGGYDPDQDDDDSDSPNFNRNTDSQGNAIYMVDAQTGALLWRADETTYPDMKYSIPATLTVADTNGSSFANQIYVGDMGGQVWRFDVNTGNDLADNYASNNDFINGGVIADLASGGSNADARRFYQSPDVAILREDSGDSIAVTIGSGWRAKPTETGVNDRFYMLKIADPYSAPVSGTYTKLTESPTDLYDATDDLVSVGTDAQKAAALTSLNGTSGWYIKLGTDLGNGSGEKVLSTPLTIQGVVLFATFEPTSRLQDCAPTPGTARAYAVNLFNGSAANNVNRFETLKSGTIVDEPVVIITQSTDGDEITTSGTVKFGTEDPALDDDLLGNDLATRTFWYQKD